MPRTRGGDVGGGGSGRGKERGRGRGRGRGVEPEGVQVLRGAKRGRGVRTRGSRGRGAQEIERSSFYVGEILTTAPDSATVDVGIPLEEPLHKKVPRRWDPNQPKPSLAESIATFTSSWTRPTPRSSSVPSPVESIATSALAWTPRSSVPSPEAEPVATPEVNVYASQLPSPASQVPSPADFREIGTNANTPQSARTSSSVLVCRKRKLIYNVLDPELENIVNYGSDDDDQHVDEDDDGEYGWLAPRSDRVFLDSLIQDDYFSEESQLLSGDLPASAPSATALLVSVPSATTSSASAPSVSTPSDSASVLANFGPHSMGDFEWKALPKPAISPHLRRETFTGARVGPTSTFSSPYEAFVSIWDRSFMEYIAAETNRYADQTLEVALDRGDLGGHSRKLLFNATNADEIYVFFAIIIATGIVHKTELTEYWSVNNKIFDTPVFGRYMTYTRFQALCSMLHFFDNNNNISHLSKSEAKIAKIAPVVEHLNVKFQALYHLGQCVALDESLTQWKGWLSINQFIKNKAAAKGVKTYEVCDSKTGYLWRFKMHAGRSDDEVSKLGYITPLVLELLQGLENKGHTIFMDNYYNSPMLARILKSRGYDCAGTLRLNRQHVPANLKALVKKPLSLGSLHGATSGDVDVLIWKDKNVVALISTYHGAASAARDGKGKPTLVHDYNVRMGGVDKKDQMLSAYPIERKRTAVWYKKFFRRLLNVSVLNAFILHKESPPPEHPHTHFIKHRNFRKNLVDEILAKHGQLRPTTLEPMHAFSKVKFSQEMASHFPREFPYDDKWKQRKRSACGVCKKRTQYQCIGCNVALCIDTCFLKFHS